jgi:hypothetical protein
LTTELDASGKGSAVPTGQEAGWASELVWTQKLEQRFLTCGPRTPGSLWRLLRGYATVFSFPTLWFHVIPYFS